ncbi:MAG: hypothetical protein KAR44_03300 [Candidatus Aegiribacteria sp.]|nr:hypothetical protein [Candidatus Aegiribacteria sp.]
MWYIAAVVGIVLAGTLTGVVKSRGIAFSKEESTINGIINSAALKPLSMQQVNFLLARLEREEQPEIVFGAMCYDMMAAPAVAEYICPVCGEKTLYDNFQTAFIEWELQGARRLAESLDASTEFQITLDETLFCDYCSEDSEEEPSLILHVLPEQGEEVVNRVSLTDLRKLDFFLQGQLYWVTENDSQEPLQGYVDRLRLLLGLVAE